MADQSVTLTWNPSLDTNAVGYDIYYGGASGVYTNTVFVSSATAVTISGLSEGVAYYFSATTVSASGAQSAFSNEAMYVIPQANTNSPVNTSTTSNTNQPPTLDGITNLTLQPIANLTLFQGAPPQTIVLTGFGASSSTAKSAFKISTSSSNPRLIPAPLVSYPGSAQSAQLILKPSTVGTGSAIITVKLQNGTNSNQQTFKVMVLPVPPPTLDPIADVTVARGAGIQTLTLTGITSGLPGTNQILQVTASSSNPRVVLCPTIQYTNPANTALLTFMPARTSAGVATVTVTVTDSSRHNDSTIRKFKISVTAPVLSHSVPVSASNPLAASASNSSAKVAARLPASSQTKLVAGSKPMATTVTETNVTAILTTAANSTGQFSFQVTGLTGGQYVVQETSDLTHWTPVQTNNAPFTFRASTTDGASHRFYRAFYAP